MYSTLGTIDEHVRYHVTELTREAEHDRLVQLALGPRRPLRSRIADWLVATADRVEGSPSGRVAQAGLH